MTGVISVFHTDSGNRIITDVIDLGKTKNGYTTDIVIISFPGGNFFGITFTDIHQSENRDSRLSGVVCCLSRIFGSICFVEVIEPAGVIQ